MVRLHHTSFFTPSASTVVFSLYESLQVGETYKKLSRMINKVRKISKKYAIIIMVFCVESGAKGAEGHGIVLVAAPLRLYWLLRR